MPSVTVNNVKINYIEQGTGDEAIVFIHGFFPAALGSWQEALELLPPHYHAYALDLRGYGQSERVKEGFTIAQFAEDVYNFSQQLGLGKFTCVGHSMGGAIGMQLALDHPDALKAQVLVASVPSRGTPRWLIASMASRVMKLIMPRRSLFMWRRFMAFIFTTRPSDQRQQEVVAYSFAMEKEAFSASIEAFTSFNVGSRLGEMKLPTLVIAADKDWFCSVARLRRTAAGIHGSRFEVFEGNGHCLHIESPKRFVDLLTSFITEVSTR